MTLIDPNKIMAEVQSFPSLSGAAVKMLSLLNDPEADISQIEEILRYDPGLTVNILRLTNSAYFGLPQKIGSIRQAIVLLGWKRLTHLVMATCVNAVMEKQVPGYDLSPGELWRHSIAVSVAAEELIKELKIQAVPEIFTAALVHDLGKLVLGRFVKDELETIIRSTNNQTPFIIAERKILGTDHAEIGARILEKWSFPPEIVSAVRWHHEPELAGEESMLIDIVHLANVLCLMLGIGVGVEGLQYEPSPMATKRLGVKTDHLETVASRLLEWVQELTEQFNAK